MTYHDAMIRASAHFLSEMLPKGWDKMDDLDIFLLKNVWEKLSTLSPDEIFDLIDSLANDFLQVYRKKIKVTLK